MQSGFGEMQQFMVDGSCPSSLFSSMSSPSQPPTNPQQQQQQNNSPSSDLNSPHHKFHPLSHPPPPGPPHFPHFGHPVPITQLQLFHQSHPHPHQFQLFHHQQHQHHHLGLDQDLGPQNPNSPARMMRGSAGATSFLAAMNFKLGVDEGGGGGGGDDGINLQGDDDRSWQRDDHDAQASIKQPFWRPLDIDYMNSNNKRPPLKDKQAAEISSNVKHFKKSDEVVSVSDHNQTVDGNYKLFSELEAIYKPGSGSGGGGGTNCNNQTGSGSALTGDDNPIMPVPAIGPAVENQPDNISDTSNGGAQAAPPQSNRRKQRSKRRQEKTLASVATFFETLVKQLMEHQESLHRKFLQVMEKRDQERSSREEAWWKHEAAKANREAASRAQELALAAARESTIVSFIEKITGESLNLPTKPQPQFDEESHDKQQHDVTQEMNLQNEPVPYNADSKSPAIQMSSSRWPKAEVQALIRVRSGFETRFQEPGLKGPLWEEVSVTMATLGYQRSAKRCKEKWENINKYFRKAKDSGKKRPQHSKTCPYFHQLDQLYSKSSSNNTDPNDARKDNNFELLDAIVVSNDQAAAGKRSAEFNNEANNEEEDKDEGDDIGEEGQGESQEQARDRESLLDRDHPQLETNDVHRYFRRVQS